MEAKDDSAWVFDSLVGFLQGPIWSAPLMTFIEEKSLIFESDTDHSDEYRAIYEEYKNLVDLLLGCYMEDMGIQPEQFERACAMNKDTKVPVHFHQSLFEQIWAANEYEIFKNMMIQKNLELQLQALSMIEQKFGLTPASLSLQVASSPEDELVMEQLFHSKDLQEPEESEPSVQDNESLQVEHERLKAEYESRHAILENVLRRPNVESTSSKEQSSSSMKSIMEKFDKTPLQQKLKAIGESEENFKDNYHSSEDVKKRQKYLKEQRDKLVALKKQARSRGLEKEAIRPSSARVVAEATIGGKRDLGTSIQPQSQVEKARQSLAARLKAEVVQK